MSRQSLEIEVKALHKRIESQKAQRAEAMIRWKELLEPYHKLDHDNDEKLPKSEGKEFMKLSRLISQLNYSIMGAQREYKEKTVLLIQYIVE